MTSDQEFQPITCYSYTFARRYPLVIGKIGGWVPWWGPATPTQYGVGVGSVALLLATRAVWAHFGPANVLIVVATPFALAWSLRAARIENRAPYKALLGLLTLLGSAPRGTLRGRPVRRTRVVRLGGDPVFVSELPLLRLSDSDGITVPMAQALLGGRGGSELPPHGQDNHAEITRTRRFSNTQSDQGA